MRRPRQGLRLLFVDNQVEDFVRYRMALARALRDAGFEVHVALPLEPGLSDIAREGMIVHVIHLRRLSTRPLDELRCLLSLTRLYRRVRPTVVHHICLKPTLYGGFATRVVGVPAAIDSLNGLGYLFTIDGVKARFLRTLVAHGLRFLSSPPNHRLILQNGDDLDSLIAGGIAHRDRTTLIRGSGVSLDVFTPTPEPQGPPTVLLACRMLWEKGVREFVEASRLLRARGITARFVLVGEPDEGHPSAIPRTTLEDWHAGGDIEWLGLRHDMPAVLATSHIVCLPSYYGEGLPRILVEAMASARPVVTTDTPGCRDVVRHGENGLIVKPRSGAALADALARLIQSPRMRAAMGRCGRTMAAAEFSLEQVVDAHLAVYQALLTQIGGPGDGARSSAGHPGMPA